MTIFTKLYLTPKQHQSVLDALSFCTIWLSGSTDAILKSILNKKLNDSNGKTMDLSRWGNMEARFAQLNKYTVSAPRGGWKPFDIGAPNYLGPLSVMSEAAAMAKPAQGTCWDSYSKTNTIGVSDGYIHILNIDSNKLELEEIDLVTFPEFENKYCRLDNVYPIELNMAYLKPLLDCMDIYSRCLTHQWEFLKNLSPEVWIRGKYNLHDIEEKIFSTQARWCGYSSSASHGIYGKVHEDARTVWGIYKSLKNIRYFENQNSVVLAQNLNEVGQLYIHDTRHILGDNLKGKLFFKCPNRLKEMEWHIVDDPREKGYPIQSYGTSSSLTFLNASIQQDVKTPSLDF